MAGFESKEGPDRRRNLSMTVRRGPPDFSPTASYIPLGVLEANAVSPHELVAERVRPKNNNIARVMLAMKALGVLLTAIAVLWVDMGFATLR